MSIELLLLIILIVLVLGGGWTYYSRGPQPPGNGLSLPGGGYAGLLAVILLVLLILALTGHLGGFRLR